MKVINLPPHPKKMEYNAGHPWGIVEVPQSYYVEEVLASCMGECEEKGAASTGHFACYPSWRKEVKEKGGIVLDVQLVDNDWKALVAFPKKGG